MNTSNNVIVFPNSPNVVETIQDVKDRMEEIKFYHIHEAIDTIAPILFGNLDIAGFDISSETEEGTKNGAFIIESIRSVLCKYYGIYHPFQKITDNIFTQDEDDEGSYRIVDSLNLNDLKNEYTQTNNVICEAN